MQGVALPGDLIGLAMVVGLLGARHGLDADHLSAIDSLTRFNTRQRPQLAARCGVLFSFGHGTVVFAVALAVALAAQTWQAPGWLSACGAWLSITVLTLLALLNISAVLRTPGHEHAALVGWRSVAFSRLLRAGSPLLVMGVGTLFALSFDTLSLAVLFGATAIPRGGAPLALALALLFVGGMTLVDGLNGRWIAHLAGRSDRSALVASRTMGLAVAGIGLLTAALGAATQLLPAVDAWAAGKGLWFGAAIAAVVLGSYGLGQRLARGVFERSPAVA
jgi:high-affinity nickel-transport protein